MANKRMKLIALATVLPLIGLWGCGGGGASISSLRIGLRAGVPVYMQPAAPKYTFPQFSGTVSGITIDSVTPFASTVHPNNTNIYSGTTQVAYGHVTGPTSGVQVYVYSYTNEYYIQPLTGTTIDVSSSSTWIAPAQTGTVTAVLVRSGYTLPDTIITLPAVDGVNVLAIANQP